MTKFVINAAVILGAILSLPQTPAEAFTFNTKSYVSNKGNDANDCASVATACATFQRAVNVTVSGGEVSVVDTGDYGEVIINNKSLFITNDGAGEASIRANSVSVIGISIDGGNGDIVGLRGLVIDGGGPAGAMIGILARIGALHIQNCVIRNFEAPGTSVGLWNVSVNGQMFVSDTLIYNNGNNSKSAGLAIEPQNKGVVYVALDRLRIENNVIGLWVNGSISTGGARVVLRDSVVSGNVSDGIRASTIPSQAPAFIVVERTSVVNNVRGIVADGPRATMLLSDNTITLNGEGLSAINSGQLISFGNNRNANNLGPEGAPTSLFSQM